MILVEELGELRETRNVNDDGNPERRILRMAILKPKNCLDCGIEFQPSGPAAKYCSTHAEERRKERGRRGTQNYRIRHGLIEMPGVGSGNNQKGGVGNPGYKTGIAYFMKNRKRIRDERRFCNRCGKDLLEATRYEWCVHHIDHDRSNNEDSNFELLCKKCHQIEHDAYLHLPQYHRATTIPEAGVGPEQARSAEELSEDLSS